MRKKFSRLFLFGLCAIFQFSCTSLLIVDTMQPAEVTVKVDQWKVAVVNRFNAGTVPAEEEREVYGIGAKEAYFGAVDAVIEDSTFVLVHSDSAAFTEQNRGGKISQAELREIHQKNPFHLLLSLDDFKLEMRKESDLVNYENGSTSNIIYHNLVTTATWTLQDSLGNVLDQAKISEEALYQSTTFVEGLIIGAPKIKNAGAEIKEVAWFTGYDYWKRLWPQQLRYSRPFYSSGKLGAAAKSIAEKDWEGAIEMLEPLSYGRSKQAAKACYNIAVIYEAMGQIETAKFWASEAIRKNNPLAKNLLMVLEKK